MTSSKRLRSIFKVKQIQPKEALFSRAVEYFEQLFHLKDWVLYSRVHQFIKDGKNVNATVTGTNTALDGRRLIHYCVQEGAGESVDLLLRHGADPSLLDGGPFEGCSALEIAAIQKSHKMLKKLLPSVAESTKENVDAIAKSIDRMMKNNDKKSLEMLKDLDFSVFKKRGYDQITSAMPLIQDLFTQHHF